MWRAGAGRLSAPLRHAGHPAQYHPRVCRPAVGRRKRRRRYFTLCAASVTGDTLPDALRRKLPRYPVPVALLGRLAVAETCQGKGLGSIVLADACRKIIKAKHVLAVAGLIVDAKHAPAAALFYRHFGFVDLPGQPGRLLLTASSMRT